MLTLNAHPLYNVKLLFLAFLKYILTQNHVFLLKAGQSYNPHLLRCWTYKRLIVLLLFWTSTYSKKNIFKTFSQNESQI